MQLNDYSIKEFTTQNGETIDMNLVYAKHGELSATRDNAILVATSYSATHEDAAALFALIYFGVGIFIIYFFRKRHTGRFGGQGYKFPAIIYFIAIPIIIAIGTDLLRDYDPEIIYSFNIDFGLLGIAFFYVIVPTVIYISIGLYILSLEPYFLIFNTYLNNLSIYIL